MAYATAPTSQKIYLGSLPDSISDERIRQVLHEAGVEAGAEVAIKPSPSAPGSYAFVDVFASDVDHVVKRLSGEWLFCWSICMALVFASECVIKRVATLSKCQKILCLQCQVCISTTIRLWSSPWRRIDGTSEFRWISRKNSVVRQPLFSTVSMADNSSSQ